MMTLGRAADLLGGQLRGEDVCFASVSTDSRTLPAGALFVALRGDRFDGHDYLVQVRDAGAAAALVDRRYKGDAPLPLARVDDTTDALGALAAHWRRQFAIPVIAVSGSNGKTTVKEMIAACLRAHFGEPSVLATAGNLNNHIGLPLTLLCLRVPARAAVVEIGMNHPGETARLAGIAAPTVAVITNAQREHQEFMRSVEDVAREHASLIDSLGEAGVAVLNADDANLSLWRRAAGGRHVSTFGFSEHADVSGQATQQGVQTCLRVRAGGIEADCLLRIPGTHNARNALAAIASVTAVGVPLDTCLQALSQFSAVKGRLQVWTTADGATVLDDTYNANPDSVLAAVDVLAGAAGPTALVLGDMGEVGEQGPAFHREVGAYAAARGIDCLLTLGELAAHASTAFGAGAVHCASLDQLVAEIQGKLTPAHTLLVKGSRFMRMERVVAALVHTVDGGH
jgi:UDP-N-acetylmuramoyl-tripeptide--D-alanyl-D-alanine ligase